MKKTDLVFIPAPGSGHLYSAIEFANLLVERDQRLSITVLVMMKFSEKVNTTKLASASHSNLSFIELPHVEPPPRELMFKSTEKYVTDFIDSHRTCVKDAIVNHVLPNSHNLFGFLVDWFCSSMIDVANELRLPSYVFYPGGACSLAFMLHVLHRHDLVGREFQESESESIVPGYINPIPVNFLPALVFNKEGGYNCFVNLGRRLQESKGIIVNTFQDLESHVISSLISAYHDLSPLYTVGPLINHKIDQSPMRSKNDHDEIMKWLDEQPESSVVFLCFGSAGCFGVPQLKEIALGLERSGHRFLWSIRIASEDIFKPIENIEHKVILPEGFLDRTRGRGFICGWAPQVKVLGHKAVRGFVSHCGWNSILESLWFGVPILTWPQYAEQQLNAFELVKELGLAFELKLDSRMFSDEIVKGDEIAQAVKCLMEEDSEVRKRVKDMSVKSRKALITGGSSYATVGHWIETMLAGN
ncbi:hypothetical protein L6164_028904 [Bauhinia variegata]|uniref:Uncharacterized protein n=1 Tax=Bauhinia variegata TaxID=167791 RepID=A0ACB9L7W7_BAUVA|nr:hypothetical protein L6164_028904 [Bauhinia variegata]